MSLVSDFRMCILKCFLLLSLLQIIFAHHHQSLRKCGRFRTSIWVMPSSPRSLHSSISSSVRPPLLAPALSLQPPPPSAHPSIPNGSTVRVSRVFHSISSGSDRGLRTHISRRRLQGTTFGAETHNNRFLAQRSPLIWAEKFIPEIVVPFCLLN